MKNYERYIQNAPNFSLTEEQFNDIVKKYEEPHRFFHTMRHVEFLWNKIDENMVQDEKELYYVAALFHDIVYFPRSNKNEEDSVEFFNNTKFVEQYDYKHLHDGIIPNEIREKSKKTIVEIILSTKTHNPKLSDFSNSNVYSYAKHFCLMDMFSIGQDFFTEVELQVFKEYQSYSIEEYRKGRIEFIEKNIVSEEKVRIEYLKNKKYNIGIFAGTFNPIHLGHLDVLEKAEKIFDKVIIVCAKNASKKGLDHDSIFHKVKDTLPFHEVVQWDGLVTDYVRKVEAMGAKVTLVKGVRESQDMPYEMNLYRYAQDLMPEVSVAYFPTNRELVHISSSGINSLISHGVDVSKYLVDKYSYSKKD